MAAEDLQGLIAHDVLNQYSTSPPLKDNQRRSPTEETTAPQGYLKNLQEVLRLRKEVCDLRDQLLIDRVRLKQDRAALSHIRLRASDAAAKFVAAVRASQETRKLGINVHLAAFYEEVVQTRDEYGTAETEYGQQESQYSDKEHLFNSKEWELGQKEDHLFMLLEGVEPRPASMDADGVAGNVDETVQKVAQAADTGEMSLLKQYNLALGKEEMLRERLEDLAVEQKERLEEQERRKAMHLNIVPLDQDFLDQFPALYHETLEELQAVVGSLKELREKLPEMPSKALSNHREPVIPETLTQVSSTNPQFPYTIAPAKSESAIGPMIEQYAIVRRRIGDWILEGLGSSPIERARHKAALENENLDNDEWWLLVKRFWNRDETTEVPSRDTIELICMAESCNFSSSAKETQLRNQKSLSGTRVSDAALEGRMANNGRMASQSTTSLPEYSLRHTTDATDSAETSFDASLPSGNLSQDAKAQDDIDTLYALKALHGGAPSKTELNLKEDLDLQMPYWASIIDLENGSEEFRTFNGPSTITSTSAVG